MLLNFYLVNAAVVTVRDIGTALDDRSLFLFLYAIAIPFSILTAATRQWLQDWFRS